MNETLIQTISLNNGLTVGLFDASRKIAGDRWQVTLLARMEIPVDAVYLRAADLPNALEIKQALGETVIFEVKKQRNFIGEPEKQPVFDNMKDTFIKVSLPYLSHPEFPKRHIARQFAEFKKRRAWER
ncbi:MAG: hypothetical protein WA081_09120 [Desulfosalsimonadaceae bacterium]